MALIRSLPRLDLSTVNQTLVDAGLGPLSSLSQRKLNALGLPLAYVDRQQRYRFVNTAFLDWLGKREDEVIGREISEV
ncbi:MAG: PAS domain-containing protein, partial [Casimicrobiaceae bacterium]